ncbi:MAG: 50S ribosomal protein L18 [Parcubacteria group bacterium]
MQLKREARKRRTRKQIKGKVATLLRLSVFRSLKHFSVQIIDDNAGKTLCSASDLEVKDKKKIKPVEIAAAVGKLIAEKAQAKKISAVVYDRGAYKYHGRVKAAAEAARAAGLKF